MSRKLNPAFTSISAHANWTSCGAYDQHFTSRIHGESVSIYQFEGGLFRQSLAQSFESFPAVLRPRDDEFFIYEIAMLVFFRGNEPSRVEIIWVDGNREAKIRGSHIFDLIPGPSSVVRAIDRRVMLDSESVGLTAALDHAVGGLLSESSPP